MTASSDPSESQSLEARLARLEQAVEALSCRLDRLEASDGRPVPNEAPPSAPRRPERRSLLEGLPRIDWETFIGGQGALWVGSAALFLAVAFFLAYAWQFLGPAGRAVSGFLLGACLIALGAFTRRRAQGWFGVGVMGAGLAILYLNTWAGFQQSALFGPEPAFAMMIAITLVGVALAVRLEAMSLIALATLGGFMTPRVLGAASEDPLPLLLYIAVLNTGIVATSLFKRWRLPVWLSFLGTTTLFLGLHWMGRLESLQGAAFAFLTLYFLQFLGASCFYSLRRQEPTPVEDLLLPCLAALFYALAGYGLIREGLGAFPAAFPLALTALFAMVSRLATLKAPLNSSFRNASTAMALFFLTLAAPMQLKHDGLAAAWAAEAALLETLGIRLASPLFRRAGQGVFILFAGTLATVYLAAGPAFPSIVDEGGMALAIGVGAMGWLVYWSSRWKTTGRAVAAYSWSAVLGLAALIHHELASWEGGARMMPEFLVFGAWGLLAAGTHRLGLILEIPALRRASLMLAGLALLGLLTQGTALEARPVLNLRFLAFGLVTGAFLAIAASRDRLPETEARPLAFLPLGVTAFALWGLTLEAFAAFQHSGIPNWERPAQLAISLLWIVCGVLLLGYGVRRKRRGFRLLALGVLGMAALKVFLHDLASLDVPLRILSFGGLGIVLIGISWLYSRFGLQREPEGS